MNPFGVGAYKADAIFYPSGCEIEIEPIVVQIEAIYPCGVVVPTIIGSPTGVNAHALEARGIYHNIPLYSADAFCLYGLEYTLLPALFVLLEELRIDGGISAPYY